MQLKSNSTFDTVVVGAGVFGAWTAYHLRRQGQTVALLDAYGAANSRASSGGESRVIRMGYGADEIYTRSALRSLALWRDFFGRLQQPTLFRPTGVLWLAPDGDPYSLATLTTLARAGISFEHLATDELRRRYPQIAIAPATWGIFEPDSGVLMARRAVQAVVGAAIEEGASYLPEAVAEPQDEGQLASVRTLGGRTIHAKNFVFACGPWLAKVFPELLRNMLHVTRQEVYFFGVAAGDARFTPPAMPAWIDFTELVYAIPDIENRGLKMAIDRHGATFDPDTGERIVTPEGIDAIRQSLARRLPALRDAPITETRVCQYENTSNGDFLVDLHPDFSNVWIVGGGSGHGFKHGPALGEYVAARVTRTATEIEPRWTFAARSQANQRTVY